MIEILGIAYLMANAMVVGYRFRYIMDRCPNWELRFAMVWCLLLLGIVFEILVTYSGRRTPTEMTDKRKLIKDFKMAIKDKDVVTKVQIEFRDSSMGIVLNPTMK